MLILPLMLHQPFSPQLHYPRACIRLTDTILPFQGASKSLLGSQVPADRGMLGCPGPVAGGSFTYEDARYGGNSRTCTSPKYARRARKLLTPQKLPPAVAAAAAACAKPGRNQQTKQSFQRGFSVAPTPCASVAQFKTLAISRLAYHQSRQFLVHYVLLDNGQEAGQPSAGKNAQCCCSGAGFQQVTANRAVGPGISLLYGIYLPPAYRLHHARSVDPWKI